MDDSCQYNLLKIIGLSLSLLLISTFSFASTESTAKEQVSDQHESSGSVDAIGHIKDSHEWHWWTTKEGEHVSWQLPVILYVKSEGLQIFGSSNFHHHGKKATLIIRDTVKDDNNEVVNIEESEKHGYVYKGFFTDHHLTKVYPVKEESADVYSIDDSKWLLDISITKNVASMFLSVIFLFVIFFAVARGYKKNEGKAPKGLQSFFEPIITYIRDDIAKDNIGDKYEKFLPYLLTIFFFIWFNNLLGLLPGAANVTGNIAVTGTLAIITLIITVANGKSAYWSHILNPLGNSMPVIAKIPLYIILIPIELIGILTKPFSLAIRLFANISAGHIIILSILGLTFMAHGVAGYVVGGVSVIFATVMMMLELFVAILQAYIFTMLSAMYFGQAVEEGHH